jgi:hypothetical protein
VSERTLREIADSIGEWLLLNGGKPAKQNHFAVAALNEIRTHAAALDAKDAEIERLKSFKSGIENATRGALDETCDANERHCSCVPLLRAENRQLVAENERLRAVVERLPKTADGVAVAPCDRVFHLSDRGTITEIPALTAINWFSVTSLRKCYSTREAAEAAKEGR